MTQGHVFDTGDEAQRVEHAGGPWDATGARIARRNLDVAVEADDKVLDFVLEALNHRRGQNHQGDPKGDPRNGDADDRPSIQCSVALRHAPCDQPFHVHNLKGKGLRKRCTGWEALLLDA